MRLPFRGRYDVLRLKIPRPCCPWCYTHTTGLEDEVKHLKQAVESLKAQLDSVESALEPRLQASLKIMSDVVNAERGRNGYLIASPETVAILFKKIYEAVDQAMSGNWSATPSSQLFSRSRSNGRFQNQSETTVSQNGHKH